MAVHAADARLGGAGAGVVVLIADSSVRVIQLGTGPVAIGLLVGVVGLPVIVVALC